MAHPHKNRPRKGRRKNGYKQQKATAKKRKSYETHLCCNCGRRSYISTC